MRKCFYAGAVVGGFLLLGAAPAQADVIPAPAGGLLSTLGGDSATQGLGLDPAGGLNLESPLGGSLVNAEPGRNSADVSGPASDLLPRDVRTREADAPGGRKAARAAAPADLPVVGGLTGGGLGGSSRGGAIGSGGSRGPGGSRGGLGGLIPANLLGGGLLGGGLTPDGRTGSAESTGDPALFDGGVPLLGGLGGLLPANETPRTLPADGDDAPTGLPAGGADVDPALVDPADGRVDPADGGRPGDDKGGKDSKGTKAGDPAADQPVDDPRLHEEPIDDEAGGKKRSFSDGGRPVAGEDQDFR
jgi:hypothetical protein